jgi:O-acetyl-ADP-ribose deacetylase (regulator of RNase III)
MAQLTKVFISYRNVDLSKIMARTIEKHLTGTGRYDVFWDVPDILPGNQWRTTIFENIYGSPLSDNGKEINGSDVLLLLLEKETGTSVWVRREIDVARGAHITILPVKIGEGVNSELMEDLGIGDLQYLSFDGSDRALETLEQSIEQCANDTLELQRALVRKLNRKWNAAQGTRFNRNHASFKLRGVTNQGNPCRIHLTTGSIIDHENIDVIVNTENNYMQMARVHERHTVSSRLRYSGALFSRNGVNLMEDTVQLELDAQIDKAADGRPIRLGKVLVTNAGHHQSDLRDKGIRYIFHAATVAVEYANRERRMMPMRDADDIKTCVINCLRKVAITNEAKGVVSVPEWRHHARELEARDGYRDLESIIFPIFGTGEAEAPIQSVVRAMLAGIESFLEYNPQTSLRHIHVCVYRERDVSIVQREMGKIFDPA